MHGQRGGLWIRLGINLRGRRSRNACQLNVQEQATGKRISWQALCPFLWRAAVAAGFLSFPQSRWLWAVWVSHPSPTAYSAFPAAWHLPASPVKNKQKLHVSHATNKLNSTRTKKKNNNNNNNNFTWSMAGVGNVGPGVLLSCRVKIQP